MLNPLNFESLDERITNDLSRRTSFWPDSLFLPFYVATASIFVLFALLWNSSSGQTAYFKSATTELDDAPATHSVAKHVENHGGVTIFAFKMARLAGCLVLLSLSLVSLVKEDDKLPSKPFAMCLTYFYASILAVLSIATSAEWGRIAVRHLNTLLLCTFGVYLYRDIFPLATFALDPLDFVEGPLLWAKIFVLFTIACIIPLVIPRQYIPVDPKTPMPVPNPEQTTSLLSLVLYSFLDPLIFLANRIPHLDFDQLPPLPDYDRAENLKAKAFPHMDVFAGKKRHIFFPILWIFRWVFLDMGVMLTIMALAAFIAPLGLNRLLNYLENPSEEAFMKPWFWILLLFLGPMAGSLAFQWYIFVSMRMVTQVTAIITQLVFEHAMRIRVKSETGGAASKNAAHGNMTNLVTTDLAHINEARNIQFLLILVPIQIIGAIFFLYQVLGWSAFVGMGVMVALFPVPGYVAKLQGAAQKATLKMTDARVQTVSETMKVLRMVKMFGWEKQMNAKIAEKREAELSKLWTRRLLDMVDGILNPLIPTLTMLATYATYVSKTCVSYITLTVPQTVIAKQDLSASKVFSSMAVFDLLRAQLWFTFHCLSTGVNGKVSLDRLDAFLHETELLDSFTSKDTLNVIAQDEASSDLIGFRDATFAWSSEETDGTLTPASRKFLLKIEGELLFKPGCINLVLGPTGSGKTSLLMALLGEMHLVPSSLSSWYNLPRAQGVSYAAQESWVMNDTIRNNILFNSPMDVERYNKVLYQCCLERDLELWDAGDETEVGERGLTLSGGQKARITLARAVFSQTQVILLDDVLAALDVHTAKWIVDKCLQGDLIKNRTVILVTHNVVLTSKIAELVVSVGLDGRVHSQASVSEALERDELLAKEVITDQEIIDAAEKEIDSPAADEPKKKDGKLIIAEEIAIGHVSWKALTLYFKGMGGSHTVPFFVVLLLSFVVNQVIEVSQTYYLGYWASQYGRGTPVAVFKYLGGFSSLLLAGLIVYSVSYIYYTFGSFRASRTIHRQLVESVMGTTLRWLDSTPTSRIIARSTVDISAVDNWIPEVLQSVLDRTIAMLTKFFAIVVFIPGAFFAGALVGIIGATLSRIYLASQLSVKREQSNTKAPVLAHFSATMAGLTSVRAYGAQEALIKVSLDRINRMSRASRTFSNLNRWVVIRIDVLGALFATSLAYYVVYFQSARPLNIGFSLNMAIGFAEIILNWVRLVNRFEVQGNSLERIQQYLDIEKEAEPTATGVPPAYWPASGSLSVDSLSAKYSPEPSAPTVLHDISFNVKSGERVGIVGRTGSGKSSLTLSLLRCIFTEGTVYYDGLPTSSINLDALRTNITIIPQIPELLVGSLRSNLDIFEHFDDATLNNALRSAGLSSLQEDMDEGKLTLDTEISAGGTNLSVGQRQIIALARALVRGSKLLILDEATSAIDYKTDAVIQSSLRTELPADTTLLIVAHRLQTIMDADKIMVLDAGRIVEFDTPKKLLQRKDSLLRALVDESGDRDALYKMAQAL
ncbi:multidrug resistance-associated ABC transporter [Mycena alexandri]|uniref:Multidrug resistance-associated ABC transporter n=1 Tax=Mycena alexandri TaxID=1745969 RepID=A0AAD6STU5_9AGAR|nr:multidrug resistance-associated ABC transporter [Mycena alexandri]